MDKKYDLAVFIGRFQPFHLGHLHVLEQCKRLADHTLVLIGSSGRPRTLKNPFKFEEREMMVMAAAQSIDSEITVRGLRDFYYSDAEWINNAQSAVAEYAVDIFGTEGLRHLKIALVGHGKDSSSWYLGAFPDWSFEEVGNFQKINATEIRERLLATQLDYDQWRSAVSYARLLPDTTHMILSTHEKDWLSEVREDREAILNGKHKWALAPYPPVFSTADAVVIHDGHILLVTRGSRPGKGLLALPGGYLEQGETLLECAIRETKEETGVDLEGCLFGEDQWFDEPSRSPRGRIITKAICFHLRHDLPRPEPVAGDDAGSAQWVPLKELSAENMFEDHWDIINYFVPWGLK